MMMRTYSAGVGKRPLIRIAIAIAVATAVAPCFRAAWAAPAAAAPIATGAKPEEGLRGVSLFPIVLHVGENTGETGDSTEVAAFSDALRSGLKRNLEAAGYPVAEVEEALPGDLPESKEASDRAKKAGSAWAAVCELSLVSGRIVYRIAIYDAEDGSLGAGDGFSAFAGLSTVSLLENATARTALKLAAYESERRGTPRRLVGYRLVVACPFEGAEVSVDLPGSSTALPAGRIEGGRLELPYYPFAQGSTLGITAVAPRHLPMHASVNLGVEAPPVIELAEPRPRYDVLVGTGSGRLMGAGGQLRLYPGSEWFFFFAEYRLYAGYDFTAGSSPLLHNEIWQGVGWYLFLPPASRFRMGYSMGYGALISTVTEREATRRNFSDFALLPVNLFGEYSLKKDMGIWMSLGFAYSPGASENGLLEQGWIGNGAPSLSVGALWRRR
jgi:hypothetical protein